MLDFLIGKAPSVFTMENELLRPPDNGENEMSASCYTVYKALPSRLFHVILTIDLHSQCTMCKVLSALPGIKEEFFG